MAFESLTAMLSLDATKYEAGIEDAADATQSLEGRVNSASRRMQTFGAGMTAAVTAPLLAVAGKSIQTASRVEESTAKMEAVFGDLSGELVAWSRTTSDALNRSRFELQKTATNFADLLVPMGASREEALDLSTQLTTLTQDLSSFNNVAARQVQQDLQSALVGQSEAVRKYGIDVSQTAVNQELMRSGMAESAEEATRMQEAQARLNIIMEDSEDALGNAAKTSDSFKNQLRGLKGSAREAGAQIGQQLLPAATLLVSRADGLVSRLGNLSEEQQRLIVGFGGVLAVAGPTIAALGTLGLASTAVSSGLATLSAGYGVATGAATTFAGGLTGTVIPALIGTQVAAGPVTVPLYAIVGAAAAVGAAGVGLYKMWTGNIWGFRDVTTDAFNTVRGWLQATPGWVLALLGPVGQMYLMWRENLFGVRDLVGSVFGFIGDKISWLVQKVKSIPGIADDALSIDTEIEEPAASGFEPESSGESIGKDLGKGINTGMAKTVSGDQAIEKVRKKRDALAKEANQADLAGNEERGDKLSEQVKELSFQLDKMRDDDGSTEVSIPEGSASGRSPSPAARALSGASSRGGGSGKLAKLLKQMLSEIKTLQGNVKSLQGAREIDGTVEIDPESGLVRFVDGRIDRRERQNFDDLQA